MEINIQILTRLINIQILTKLINFQILTRFPWKPGTCVWCFPLVNIQEWMSAVFRWGRQTSSDRWKFLSRAAAYLSHSLKRKSIIKYLNHQTIKYYRIYQCLILLIHVTFTLCHMNYSCDIFLVVGLVVYLVTLY